MHKSIEKSPIKFDLSRDAQLVKSATSFRSTHALISLPFITSFLVEFLHKQLNHSRYLVDPITQTCTNAVENFCRQYKGSLR